MKRIVFAAALCGALFSSSAPAQTIDSADGFYAACKAANNLDLCAMYMAGFTGGVQAQSVVSKGAARYCLPAGTTHKQNLDTVLSYLSANPDKRGQPTPVVVYLALTQAHPCK
jgi:hypothetical protein